MRTPAFCDAYWQPAYTVRAGLSPLEQHSVAIHWVEHVHRESAGTHAWQTDGCLRK